MVVWRAENKMGDKIKFQDRNLGCENKWLLWTVFNCGLRFVLSKFRGLLPVRESCSSWASQLIQKAKFRTAVKCRPGGSFTSWYTVVKRFQTIFLTNLDVHVKPLEAQQTKKSATGISKLRVLPGWRTKDLTAALLTIVLFLKTESFACWPPRRGYLGTNYVTLPILSVSCDRDCLWPLPLPGHVFHVFSLVCLMTLLYFKGC